MEEDVDTVTAIGMVVFMLILLPIGITICLFLVLLVAIPLLIWNAIKYFLRFIRTH